MGWNLPPGCTDADVDRAAPGYDDDPTDQLLDTLYELADYLQNEADADFVDGRYRPNKAMALLVEVKAEIERIERLKK